MIMKKSKDIFTKTPLIKVLLFNLLVITCFIIPVQSQSADIFAIPENYEVEGIPQIKSSEVEHLFYDSTEIRSNLIWDVDGKNRRMLVTDETNNIFFVNTPLSKPIKLIDKIFPFRLWTKIRHLQLKSHLATCLTLLN